MNDKMLVILMKFLFYDLSSFPHFLGNQTDDA
jgi:hypothetical protein